MKLWIKKIERNVSQTKYELTNYTIAVVLRIDQLYFLIWSEFVVKVIETYVPLFSFYRMKIRRIDNNELCTLFTRQLANNKDSVRRALLCWKRRLLSSRIEVVGHWEKISTSFFYLFSFLTLNIHDWLSLPSSKITPSLLWTLL